jgi:limonene-1,2-epoxide hydrolase
MSVKVLAEVKNFMEKLRTAFKPQTQQMGLLDILEIRVFDKDGNLKDMRRVVDLIVNAGLAEVAALLLADVSGTAFDYIAIGTGTTAPSASDTALEFETHRVAATGSRVTTNVTDDTAQLVATFSGYSGTEAITEAGVFNAAAGGIMLCRQTFNALNVDWDAGDSVEITEKIVCQGA